MERGMDTAVTPQKGVTYWLKSNAGLLGVLVFFILFPFIAAILDGQSPVSVFTNETGSARFLQGLMIEIFILAVYALSYDLVLGITGLLSFGQAMFFAAGAYMTGIALKSFGWGLGLTLLAVVAVGVFNAFLFALVLPRVKGITFALVTLGLASVFEIMIKANEFMALTGADVGLQGVIIPDWIDTTTHRFRFYLIVLFFTFFAYLIYRRFVDSPTGHVCVAIRENENRALMLGYNTFYFKLTALIVSSITAALAGFFHALHQPIVSPAIAGLGWTVVALLVILIGGIGTLSGALIGAAVFRLLQFYLDKWFGESADFLLGLIYILLVMFVPYGIVGTWRVKKFQIKEGRKKLAKLLNGKK